MKGMIGTGDTGDSLSVGPGKIKPSGNLTPKVPSSSQGGSAASNGAAANHNLGNLGVGPTGSFGFGKGA